MKHFYITFFILFSIATQSQVVINELDTDTPSTDQLEIIELLITPETSLDGYVLVFFNGSNSGNDSSYLALDLDGLVSDSNGIVLLGSNNVSPVPDFILFDSTIQNGADAIAIYQGNASDWPDGTQATTTNLIDALVYDTNDSDDTELLALLGETEQINEGSNGSSDINSIQLNNTGGYDVTIPTPGQLNDGSGTVFNLVGYTIDQEEYDEGDTVTITFTTTEEVTEEVTFTFTLTNGGFASDDFSGETQITFAAGVSQASLTIQLEDDQDDEGDEVMRISFEEIPEGFKRANDNLTVRVIDNDFTTAAWGTPLDPTFGLVESTQPENYYASIDGLAGEELVQGVASIVANPEVVRWQTYADVIDILKEADQSPLNSNQVWLVYTEQQRAKLDFQTSGGSNIGLWNREHTYPRSRGGFDDIEEDDIADGINVYGTTSIDSLRHANSDAHALRAADGPENSSRGNQNYGEYSGPDNAQGSFLGDVARGVLFLAIRYNGLEVVSGNPDTSEEGQLGDLDVLLEWHRNDPPDDYEMNRNNVVYNWQLNRNPFIDMPDLVEFIWGNNVGETWVNPLSVDGETESLFAIYPNPTSRQFVLNTRTTGQVVIYNTTGQKVYEQEFDNTTSISHNLTSGLYLVEVNGLTGREVQKLLVK